MRKRDEDEEENRKQEDEERIKVSQLLVWRLKPASDSGGGMASQIIQGSSRWKQEDGDILKRIQR